MHSGSGQESSLGIRVREFTWDWGKQGLLRFMVREITWDHELQSNQKRVSKKLVMGIDGFKNKLFIIVYKWFFFTVDSCIPGDMVTVSGIVKVVSSDEGMWHYFNFIVSYCQYDLTNLFICCSISYITPKCINIDTKIYTVGPTHTLLGTVIYSTLYIINH